MAATVVALYNALETGAALLKVPAYQFNSSARPEPTDSGVTGQVIATRRGGEIASVQDVLYIDRGADDGVHLGDIFHITTAPERQGAAARDQADAIVVHARAKTATLVVLQVSQPDIRPGAAARQVRRMPS